MESNIIFGKNPTERIVSCEVHDDQVKFFIETENGVEEKTEPNVFWILSSRQVDDSWQRMDGNLYYKWAKINKTEQGWRDDLRSIQNRRIDFYTNWNPKENSMLVKGFTYFKGMKPQDVSMLSFDLETTGTTHDRNSYIVLISNTYRKGNEYVRQLFSHDEYASQAEMLEAWAAWVRRMDPSLLLTYNGNTFDYPYLLHVAKLHNVKLNLGRDGSELTTANRSSKFRKNDGQYLDYYKPKVYGRECVDVYFLAVRYDIGKKYDNYKLKYIINYEGLEKEDRAFYDASKIRFNYKNPVEMEKIKAYAIDDADDSIKLYDLMVPAQFYAARSIPKPFQVVTESATGSQINSILVREYLNRFHSIPKGDQVEEYGGAISIGVPGIYRNVRKVDVASLYPSIMLEYNVYPKHKDVLGIFPTFLRYFRNSRLEHKRLAKETGDQYYKDMEQTEKVFINSSYGFMGTSGLNFNSVKDADRVTEIGREILMKGVKWASGQSLAKVVKRVKHKGTEDEECDWEWKLQDTEDTGKGFKIVNLDTDSFSYVNPQGGDFQAELAELNTLYPDSIRWEDDGEYKAIVVIKAKNYYMVEDKPGKVKVKGSGLKASNKEKALQEMIWEVLDYMGTVEHDDMDIINNAVGDIYNKYVKEVTRPNIEIGRWTTKKSITPAVLQAKRTNEAKVLNAIKGTEYTEGDKIRVYFATDLALKLEEHYNKDHDVNSLLGKIHDTLKIFGTILDVKRFPDFTLKRNQVKLKEFYECS